MNYSAKLKIVDAEIKAVDKEREANWKQAAPFTEKERALNARRHKMFELKNHLEHAAHLEFQLFEEDKS